MEKNIEAMDVDTPESTGDAHGLTEIRTSLEKLKQIIDSKGQLCPDKAALSLSRMAATYPESFIPHVDIICEIVEKLAMNYQEFCQPYYSNAENGSCCEAHEPNAAEKRFLEIVASLLPTLVPSVNEGTRDKVYGLLTHIADRFREILSDEQIPSIWNCLKIAMKNGGLDEEGFYCAFTYNFDNSVYAELDSKEENFRLLLLLLEAYCRTDGHIFETFSRERVHSLYEKICKGKELVSYLPGIMEMVFKMLDQGIEGILSCMDFETADENMLPYLPQLKKKFGTLLVNRIVERGSASGDHVAADLFDDSDDHKVRAGLLSFFRRFKKVEFLPKIMPRLLASLRMSEENSTENIDSIHDEKEQAIKTLEQLVWYIGMEYVEASIDAVEGQLNHPKDTIREPAIRAFAHFVILFCKMNKIERSQHLAAKMVPHLAKILKMDIAPIVATAVFGAYHELLCESTSIFDGEMPLFNEIFNCVNDVMGAKVACQVGTDFYDNPILITAALEVFGELGKKMQPIEFCVHFTSILPILCERLKSAKQTPSEYRVSRRNRIKVRFDTPMAFERVKDANQMKSAFPNSFRYLVYKTFKESICRLGAYAGSSFETLFPVFLFGIRDKCELARKKAIAGLDALLQHSGEKVKDESAAFSREMSNLLAHETCKEVFDRAFKSIIRLILLRSELVPVEQFLPILVEKMENEEIKYGHDDVFKWFQMLLVENNEVLLRSLNSIVMIAFKLARSREKFSPRISVMTFLRECREKFSSVIGNAMVQDPEAARIGEEL